MSVSNDHKIFQLCGTRASVWQKVGNDRSSHRQLQLFRMEVKKRSFVEKLKMKELSHGFKRYNLNKN